ncbi:MAG: Xaa-Pro dipeptidase [candidate division Zixibacteria bacterium CG_4_9_14_3_um_filter_46_8]|nr:MAG: Xaa-Pro dipeptidase [candidate division Zixibacteria bacterium CG_4_9_14_3_um_filter_46_8]
MSIRIGNLREEMHKARVDSFLTSTPSSFGPNVAGTNGWANVHWLTGYTGSNGIALVTKREAVFITDFRYIEQAKEEIKNSGFRLIIAERDLYSELGKLKPSMFGQAVGFEAENLTYQLFQTVKKLLKGKKLIPTTGIFGRLRAVKDKSEINHIRKAVKITDDVLREVLLMVKPGVTEYDLAVEIEHRFKTKGGGISFDTIVASGWRSALPHGKASKKKLKKGDFVTFDMGATYNGYSADMTRTVVLGKASAKQKEIYNLVLKAQLAALSVIKAGLHGREADAVARNIITEHGYGPQFGHGLGHGLGLVTHDTPTLSPKSDWILGEGMVVTVEPGIYIPRWGGVRIEDDVVITANGCTILNKSPKSLIEL